MKADLEEVGLRLGRPVYMQLFKASRELEVWVGDINGTYNRFRTYQIADYSGEIPDGCYGVAVESLNPTSSQHLSIEMAHSKSHAPLKGPPEHPVSLHGKKDSPGGFAMTDANIEEIYTLASAAVNGKQGNFLVHCYPFRMTEQRIARAKGLDGNKTWKHLKQVYEAFEKGRITSKTQN